MAGFQEVLTALLGKDAPNLSPAVITRLTAEWQNIVLGPFYFPSTLEQKTLSSMLTTARLIRKAEFPYQSHDNFTGARAMGSETERPRSFHVFNGRAFRRGQPLGCTPGTR
jgi:hypothetical protein